MESFLLNLGYKSNTVNGKCFKKQKQNASKRERERERMTARKFDPMIDFDMFIKLLRLATASH